ncbi:uncharacterized protein LOC114365701 [Ostrinia furnacalis]|uniref:uncharacterized protein LOC114365701 n=1 Tax=Ostrinia furnacalis TaxID=93504 RepID=UPI00103C38B7|nr:uncharacterized protein LOC114365701 [Ostrinia furnacalis]
MTDVTLSTNNIELNIQYFTTALTKSYEESCPEVTPKVANKECIGITKAAQAVTARDIRGLNIRIISDSASVLQALKSNTITTALILECHEALQDIAAVNGVTLQWIKGHSNSLGNDAADELAKRGSDTTVFGPEPILPIPQAQIRNWLRSKTEEKHHTEWKNSEGCRQTKDAVPDVSKKFSRSLIRLNRDSIRKNNLGVQSKEIENDVNFGKHCNDLAICEMLKIVLGMATNEFGGHAALRDSEQLD